MKKIMMNPADIELISKVIKENNITGNFKVISTDDSGIGYTLDLEFQTEVNNRVCTVLVPICGVDNW